MTERRSRSRCGGRRLGVTAPFWGGKLELWRGLVVAERWLGSTTDVEMDLRRRSLQEGCSGSTRCGGVVRAAESSMV